MVSPKVFQLTAFCWLAAVLAAEGYRVHPAAQFRRATAAKLPAGEGSHLMITPQSPLVEIGTNFTATCTIVNTNEITADDLYWRLSKTVVPKEQYIKINSSALKVTFSIMDEDEEWLFCCSEKRTAYVALNGGKFIHGILLKKGYHPEKPENLSCKAVQEEDKIPGKMKCSWKAVVRQTSSVPTTYTVIIKSLIIPDIFNASALWPTNNVEVNLSVFPHHTSLEIWVLAQNQLGTEESEHLIKDAGYFVQTKPPGDVRIISEKDFPTSLIISWTHPIHKTYLELMYRIRYCKSGSHTWTYVPLADTDKYIQSFRLQSLQPDTDYVTQVSCKHSTKGYGYWSEWSMNSTQRTPEARPGSKPDVWKIIVEDGRNPRQVEIISKDPELSNGKILEFKIMIQNEKEKSTRKNGIWENIPVNRNVGDDKVEITQLKKIPLADDESIKVHVTAKNSVGESPAALLVIPAKSSEFPPVKELEVESHDGQMLLKWTPPNTKVTEYVVEWDGDGEINWQRENRSTTRTAIKGKLEPFVCYNVSVYPLYHEKIGKPVLAQGYLQQGAPLEGPTVKLKGDPGRSTAELGWEEIPLMRRRGFITNYTIYCKSATETQAIVVSGSSTSYTLTSLSRNTKYDVWIKASTIEGSVNGSNHSFITLKYDPREIEAIVVGVSLGFLFVILITMLLCFYKKDVIKENFWPKIPNPGESTIGNWSPDCRSNAETPKENCLPGISVLNVELGDAKSVFEEDKAILPLKKDKYLSEEHSSGIGGSSCMSSPRQSVSDSDEGGDMADTTASTIQYSSVVASSGYKGQNPSSQPQQSIFSRSESTQPLLDCEEGQDMSVQEGSRQSQHFSRRSCFNSNAGNKNSADFSSVEMEPQELLESLDFCSLEEDTEQTAPMDGQSDDWMPTAPVSSYMPQLGGYRPQ